MKNGKPTHLSSANDQKEDSVVTVMELDSSSSKEELIKALTKFEVIEIVYNGGLYVIQVKNQNFTEVLGELITHFVQITYVRDISKSSRRLFV